MLLKSLIVKRQEVTRTVDLPLEMANEYWWNIGIPNKMATSVLKKTCIIRNIERIKKKVLHKLNRNVLVPVKETYTHVELCKY